MWRAFYVGACDAVKKHVPGRAASGLVGVRTVVTSRETFVYSYSKLRTFASCPLKFRFRYIERIPTDLESIEAFAGKRVHEVLEALYRALGREPAPPSLGEVLALYGQAWHRAWHPAIQVAKEDYSPADYHRLGRRCLTTFYRGNWPFSTDRTLGLETGIEFDLDGTGSPRLRGVVDRVARRTNELLIHDYKTSTYLPRRDEILGDLQLAIYQLGASMRWPRARAVKLVWHFLAFGRRVTVGLGRQGIDEKRAELAQAIGAIEQAVSRGDFPARVSALCRWCSYRLQCPATDKAFATVRPPLSPFFARSPEADPPLPSPRPSLRLRPLTRRRTMGTGGRRRRQPNLAQLQLL